MSDPGELSDLPASSSDLQLRCPGCGEGVEVALESAGELVRCPYCNTDFFASPEQSHLAVVDDSTLPAAELDRESAFNQLRIGQLTALRMGAIRARSWWMIAFCMSVLTIVNLVAKAAIYFSLVHRLGIQPLVELLVAAVIALFARQARRKSAEFKREIDRSALTEPTVPPDFSPLNNGSDRWKNLENIR